jgi:ribosome maturation factor RimP
MSIDTKSIAATVEGLVEPIFAQLGYDLVECELVQDSGRWVLRLFIDREGGITLDDCERASRSIEDLLAVEDLVSVRYHLEVSSPGLDRPLRRRADFEQYVGSRIRMRTSEPIAGRSQYNGLLESVEGDEILIRIDQAQYRIPLIAVAKARLEPDLEAGKGRKH